MPSRSAHSSAACAAPWAWTPSVTSSRSKSEPSQPSTAAASFASASSST